MMKKKIFLVLPAFALTTWSAIAQEDIAANFGASITEADLEAHLSVVASDSMEGRLTATAGQRKAARYIQSHFESLGLTGPAEGANPYQQIFELEERSWGDVWVQTRKEKFDHMEEFFYFGNMAVEAGSEMDVVYVGRGTEEELEGIDLTGKAALIFAPGRGAAAEPMERCKAAGSQTFFVIYNENQDDFMSFVNAYKVYLARPQMGFVQEEEGDKNAVFYISPNMATSITGVEIGELVSMADEGTSRQVPQKSVGMGVARVVKELHSSNVVGFLEGTEMPEEVLVITAHYDHLGLDDDGGVYNGADDDGSGTVGVLEIAEAFAKAAAEGYKPRRSILFMLVSGEEKGLLGSDYYTRHPIFPLENTVTNLNIDMIGRVDEAHKDNPYFVYLIGSDKLSNELHLLSEEVNASRTELDLDYRYNDENDPNRYYYRSDHYNFAKNNIPVIFYFNGTHEDYHRTSDTVDKIHFGKMERIARLVFHTAWELANRDARPKLNEEIAAE